MTNNVDNNLDYQIGNQYLNYLVYPIYSFFVFIQVISNSSWGLFIKIGNLTSPISKTNLIVFLLLILFSFLRVWNVKQILLSFSLFLLSSFYLLKYGVNTNSIFLMSIFVGMSFKPSKLIKIDFYSRSAAVVFVIFLSLLNILPREGGAGTYTGFFYSSFSFGFTWSTVLGYLLLMMFVEGSLIFQFKRYINLLIVFLYIAIQIYLGYMTGLIGGLVAVLIFYFKNKQSFVSNFSLIMYPLLLGLSIYISFCFNYASNFWIFWNKIISSRMPIWQYYLQNWPINLFGNNIPTQTSTFGLVVSGYGAFDGAYLYFLMKYGIISLLIIYIFLFFARFNDNAIINDNHIKYWILFFVLIVTAFSETSPFLVYFSPFPMLLGSVALYKDKNDKVAL
ncbi:hypothetical protein [Oenococcus oeni]